MEKICKTGKTQRKKQVSVLEIAVDWVQSASCNEFLDDDVEKEMPDRNIK
jgi:hypothetical protein